MIKMKVNVFCAVTLLFVLVGVCECSEDKEQLKSVQTREAFGYGRDDRQERERIFVNDNLPIRVPPQPENDHFHPYPHHHEGHHHSYHDGGPSDDYPHHHHHEINEPMGPREDDDNFPNSVNSSLGIPLDFAMLINEYSVSDLLLNVIKDGPPMEGNPLLANRFGGEEGNQTERNAAQIARPAKCMPEMTTVRIAESNDPNIFYVPECTRIERCGGCCAHVLLACQPIETEQVTFSVLKTVYAGNKNLKYIGKVPVIVEKHTKCKCSCKIKQEDCNTYQEYRESECRCVCKNIDEEKKCYKNGNKKLWNPDICGCQCREIESCTTGFQFDHNECRCVQSQLKRRYILTDNQKEKSES